MSIERTSEEKEFLKNYDASKYERPSVTADIAIFTLDEDDDLNILLIKRGGHPYKDCWAIPGGFLNMNETIDEAAARELREETGIDVSDGIDLRQLMTFGTPNRDPRTYVVSIAYTALVPKGMLKIHAGDDAKDARLFKIKTDYIKGQKTFVFKNDDLTISLDDLAFDHNHIIMTALKRLKGRLNYTDDSFSLLKDKNDFEIYELQKIHEAISFTKLDRSNFRKMFLRNFVERHFVEKIGEHKDVSGKKDTSAYRWLREYDSKED